MRRVDSLGELIRLALDGRLADVHTACPGIIVAYNPALQTAQIQPAITQPVDTEGNPLTDLLYEIQPILQDVPVAFPRGGGCSITWPLLPGDSVLVVFSESDIGQWLLTGSLSNPDQLKRHGLFGGIALPCIGPSTAVLPSAMVPGVVITADLIQLGSMAAVSPVALSVPVMIELVKIATAIGLLGGSYLPGPVAATKVLAE